MAYDTLKHLNNLNMMPERKLPDSSSSSCIVNAVDVEGWDSQVRPRLPRHLLHTTDNKYGNRNDSTKW